MQTLSIFATQLPIGKLALRAVAYVTAALLVALVLGSLLNGNWTLPMDTASSSVFTA